MTDGQQAGTGEMHLGWHGDVICLGAGPVRVRWSKADARELLARLRCLLEHDHPEQECGCGQDGLRIHVREPESKQDGPRDGVPPRAVLEALRAAQRGFRGL